MWATTYTTDDAELFITCHCAVNVQVSLAHLLGHVVLGAFHHEWEAQQDDVGLLDDRGRGVAFVLWMVSAIEEDDKLGCCLCPCRVCSLANKPRGSSCKRERQLLVDDRGR